MKKVIILASLAAVSFAGVSSAQSLVAAWDFNYPASFGGLDVDGDFVNDTSANATWGDTSATFSWTGMGAGGGLSSGQSLNSNILLRPTQIASMNEGFAWIVDANSSSAAVLSLNLDLSGFSAAELTFAAGSQNGPVTLDVNGTQFGLTAGQDALQTLDISALAGLGNAVVNFTFADFTGTDNAVLDNFQVTGTAVPEPSTFAALAGLVALGFAATRRRK